MLAWKSHFEQKFSPKPADVRDKPQLIEEKKKQLRTQTSPRECRSQAIDNAAQRIEGVLIDINRQGKYNLALLSTFIFVHLGSAFLFFSKFPLSKVMTEMSDYRNDQNGELLLFQSHSIKLANLQWKRVAWHWRVKSSRWWNGAAKLFISKTSFKLMQQWSTQCQNHIISGKGDVYQNAFQHVRLPLSNVLGNDDKTCSRICELSRKYALISFFRVAMFMKLLSDGEKVDNNKKIEIKIFVW